MAPYLRLLGPNTRPAAQGLQPKAYKRFRVSGLGFRVSGVGFRVSALGFRVSGVGFRV